MMTLQESNIKRVQELVQEFIEGRPEGYMAGCSEDFKGSVLGGLIPGGADIKSKADFAAVMGSIDKHMEVKKFEPCNWRGVGDDVMFNVNWVFVWKATGKEIETTALVRKVVKDNLICEKYHMLDVEAITGEKTPHDDTAVKRVQELLKEFMEGRPEGYMAGVADCFKGSVLGGVLPDAADIKSKDEFMAVMGGMDKHMEVKKFVPYNFRALPNDDMMFNVDWEFVWKETGAVVEATAITRKVVKDNMICEKWHMVDVAAVKAACEKGAVAADSAAAA